MDIYHFQEWHNSKFSKSSQPNEMDVRDWYYVKGRGIMVIKRNHNYKGELYPAWFCNEREKISTAERVLEGECIPSLRLIGKLNPTECECELLEQVLSHGEIYLREKKRYVEGANYLAGFIANSLRLHEKI